MYMFQNLGLFTKIVICIETPPYGQELEMLPKTTVFHIRSICDQGVCNYHLALAIQQRRYQKIIRSRIINTARISPPDISHSKLSQ